MTYKCTNPTSNWPEETIEALTSSKAAQYYVYNQRAKWEQEGSIFNNDALELYVLVNNKKHLVEVRRELTYWAHPIYE